MCCFSLAFLSGRPLVSWSFGSWPSAWSSIRVMKPLVSTALSLFMWCQSRITQVRGFPCFPPFQKCPIVSPFLPHCRVISHSSHIKDGVFYVLLIGDGSQLLDTLTPHLLMTKRHITGWRLKVGPGSGQLEYVCPEIVLLFIIDSERERQSGQQHLRESWCMAGQLTILLHVWLLAACMWVSLLLGQPSPPASLSQSVPHQHLGSLLFPLALLSASVRK